MNFIDVKIDWYNSTFILYICIMLLCYFIPVATNNVKIKIDNKHFLLSSCVVGGMLLFFKCFSTTGRDLRAGYYLNFQSATSMKNYRDSSVEIGYRLFTVFIRMFTDNYGVFLFVSGIITILPLLFILKKYQEKLDISWYFIFYFSVYYIGTFSPMRSSLAASIGMIVFAEMIEGRKIKSLLFIILAASIHITSLVLLVPFLIFFSKKLRKKQVVFITMLIFFFVYFERASIFNLMAGSDRYSIYVNDSIVKFGLEQLVYYIPLFLLYYYGQKYDNDSNISKISFAYLITGFLMGMIGYVVPILARMQSLFLPFVFVVGYYGKIIKKNKGFIVLFNVICIFYCVLRFWMYISQYYNLEDIMPYTNIFGWQI